MEGQHYIAEDVNIEYSERMGLCASDAIAWSWSHEKQSNCYRLHHGCRVSLYLHARTMRPMRSSGHASRHCVARASEGQSDSTRTLYSTPTSTHIVPKWVCPTDLPRLHRKSRIVGSKGGETGIRLSSGADKVHTTTRGQV